MAESGWRLEIIKSRRRRRSIAARLRGFVVQIRLPATIPPNEEAEAVDGLCRRLIRRFGLRERASDRELTLRAIALDRRYFGGRASPSAARFTGRLTKSWANVHPGTRAVQVADRLRRAPRWVLDYLLVHELAHLVVPGHSRKFWGMVEKYRYAERAKGYLACLADLED